MAVQIVKGGVKTAEQQKTVTHVKADVLADMVDEFVATSEKVTQKREFLEAELAEDVSRLKELEKELRTQEEGHEPTDSIKLKGHEHLIELGKISKSRSIKDKEELFNRLEEIQPGLVFQLAQIALGEIDKYLSNEESEKYFAVEYKGKRKLKIVV